ncbi:unnamed protein product [Natator depressus]
MPKLSKEAKLRLQQLFKGGQFAIRWGFIPVVLYLGFKRGADPGMPEPTVLRVYFGDERLAILYRNHLMDRENEDVNLYKAKEGVHFITITLAGLNSFLMA